MESMEDIQINQLNNWLIQHLEPICDADPIVLAKYVIALIKKDKPEKNLRQKCLKQLEIFLGNETTLFVDSLFEAIKSKDYLKAKSSKSSSSKKVSGSGVSKSLENAPDIGAESSSITISTTTSTVASSSLAAESSGSISSGSSMTTSNMSAVVPGDPQVSEPLLPSHPISSEFNQNLLNSGIGQNINDDSVYSRKSKMGKTSNDSADPIDSSSGGTECLSAGGVQQPGSLDNSSIDLSNSHHNQYTVSSSSYASTSQPSSSANSVSAGPASGGVAGSMTSSDTFPSSASDSYCPTASGETSTGAGGLLYPHTPLSLRLNVAQSAYSLSSTQSSFAAPSVATSQPYEPQCRYPTDLSTTLVSTAPSSSTSSISHSLSGTDGANYGPSRIRSHGARSSATGTGSRYSRNSRSRSNSSYCSTCSGNDSSRSRSRSRSVSGDDHSSGSMSGSPTRSRDNSDLKRRSSSSRHRRHRHRGHHHSRREQQARGSSSSATNRSNQRHSRSSHRVDSRPTTSTTTEPSTYPAARSIGREHHHSSYGNSRSYNSSVGSSQQLSKPVSSSNSSYYRGNSDSNYRSSRRNHRSRYDDANNDSNNNNNYRSSKTGNYRSDSDKNASTAYKPSSSSSFSSSSKPRSNKNNYSNSRSATGVALSSSVTEGSSKSYVDYSSYGNNAMSSEVVSMVDTSVGETNKYEDTAMAAAAGSSQSQDVIPDTENSFKAKLSSLPPPPPLPHHLHHRDCPDMIQKGYCEKGPYCMYSGANTYIEPYNPEQTGTSLDPHMLMHMLPNFFMNNHRLAAVLNASGNGGLAVGSSTTSSGATTGSAVASTTTTATSASGLNNPYLKKRDNDSGPNLGGRPRELVGVSLTGVGSSNSDAGPESVGPLRTSRMVVPPQGNSAGSGNRPLSPSKSNSRWPLYRNQNNKRANNIDILATSSGANSSNKSSSKVDESESSSANNGDNYQNKQLDKQQSDQHESVDDSDQQQKQQQQQSNQKSLNANSFDKTVLVIRKIPPHLNTIGSLNGHFSKYGTVVYIQVCHDNDPESALVQFSNSFEATAAIRSTEAVFNNRFVKVFWANKAPPVNSGPIHNKGSLHGRGHQHSANSSGGGYVNMKRKHNDKSDWNQAPLKHGPGGNNFQQTNINNSPMDDVIPAASATPSATQATNDARKFKKSWSSVPTAPQIPPLLPPAPALKTISRAERAKLIKLLQVHNQSLQDALTNQQHLMKKMEAAKTTKEKSAILKLLKITMKNVEEIKQKIVSIQDTIQPSLRTTKVNINNQSKAADQSSTDEKSSCLSSASSKSSDIETEAASSTNDDQSVSVSKSEECEYADEVQHMLDKAKECDLNFSSSALDKDDDLESEEEPLGGDDDDAIMRKILRT